MRTDVITPTQTIPLTCVEARGENRPIDISLPNYPRGMYDDVAFMTAMVLVLMGNYSQTGHYGGPLAYTPYNVALHLGGPSLGAMRWDIRRPKHPFCDKFMLAGGHSIPTCYALWMILYEALRQQHEATGAQKYAFDPKISILAIDALGFRRSAGAVKTLLQDNGLADHPAFAQAKIRGIRALAGHSETTDVSNDVNGGPSGVGISTIAGKALFWDFIGAPESLKIFALEGEFAMTEGHAQEMKTAALAHQVGKRLRILLSFNNAGIDDTLIGGVIKSKYTGYNIPLQWASYGWNVFQIPDGNDFSQIFAALKAMDDWPADDRRPMIVIGNTLKGWWPAAHNLELPGFGQQLVSFPSHPYSLAMNCDYFVALAETYEKRFGVQFEGIRDGKPATEQERLLQFITNINIALSVLQRQEGLGAWVAEQLVETAGSLDGTFTVNVPTDKNPFADRRLRPENLPTDPVDATLKNPVTGQEVTKSIKLFLPPGEKKGSRRALSEIGKWMNYVTENRFFTIAADLSESINVEHSHFFGHYDPVENPAGTRLKAGIQEAVNAATILGLISQTASSDPSVHAGVWGLSGTYGAFTPLMYTPVRVFSQQNQDSPFAVGVITILAGHSGPETAADARTHFGISAPQIWTLFPRNQVINLHFWDYNDVAPGYFAAVQRAVEVKEVGIIVIHVARPDFPVADRSKFADTDIRAASKGIYLIRDYVPNLPKMGTVFVQGSSSTVNLVKVLPRLEQEGVNIRVAAVISTELFGWQPDEYQHSILNDSVRLDCMVVSTMTKRVPPIANLGPLTEEYSLYADWDDRWRTGGTESDVIAEAHLDTESIYTGILRFARERDNRLKRQREALNNL